MAEGMRVAAFLLFSIVSHSCSAALTPLIGWSNSDVLQSIPRRDAIEVGDFASWLPVDNVDAVVVFSTEELTFDDIAQLGGVFGGTRSEFNRLKDIVGTSKSSVWMGVHGANLVSALADRIKASPQVLSVTQIQNIQFTSKLVVVDLGSGFGDATVGSVAEWLESKQLNYIAIYTSTSSVSGASPRISGTRRSRAVGDSGSQLSCMDEYGKIFRDSAQSPCMLFCLTKPMYLMEGNETLNLTDTNRFKVSYDLGGNVNNCSSMVSKTGTSRSIGFVLSSANNGSNSSDKITIRFVFVNVDGFWAMSVCVSRVTTNTNYSVLLNRTSAAGDQNFLVPTSNSYACSSNAYSLYKVITNNSYDFESYCDDFTYPEASNVMLNITGIQVQPFFEYVPATTDFNTPYNCEGYFSIPILMGIFSVAVLLIILYCSIVFMFGIKTVDRFDDPRIPSITVDRLH